MLDNNKIEDSKMQNISGGIQVDGKLYVKINEGDIEGHEYKCQVCGHIGYHYMLLCSACPKCHTRGRYKETSRFYVSYDKSNLSTTNAFFNRD